DTVQSVLDLDFARYVRSLHHDQEDRERHLSELRDKRRRVHERHELHLPPPVEESSAIDTESSSEPSEEIQPLPAQGTAVDSTSPGDDSDEEEDFDEDDFAMNWRSKSM
ncbi:hypothetical protein FOZ63_003249, partial [Perkinsus olseni]